MKFFYSTLFICFFLFLTIGLAAQPYLNFYANGSVPTEGLKDSNYREGVGFSVEFLSPSVFKSKNNKFEIRLGLGFEFLHYGTSKKLSNLVFDTPDNDLGEVKIKNQMTGFYFAPKFIFNAGRFSPYIDVFGASRSFYTQQINRFNEEVAGYERQSAKQLLKNGRAHYGSSLGLLYHLRKNIVFDARLSYSTGQGIKFVDLKSVKRNQDFESNVTYRVVSTNVSNILIFRLGVMIQLKKCEKCSSYKRGSTIDVLTPARPKKKAADIKPVEPKKPIN